MRRRSDVPTRGVTEVTTGDYVKIGSRWEKIVSNSAHNMGMLPHHHSPIIRTEGGGTYSMMNVNRYAKAEDMEDR